MKISCDVTKDLLPVYLDGICSEETKNLVDTHLSECAECREFLKQLQEQEPLQEQSRKQVDFLRKVCHNEWYRSCFVFGMTVIVILTALLIAYNSTGYGYWRFALAMPFLSLSSLPVLLYKEKPPQNAKKNFGKISLSGSVLLFLYLLCIIGELCTLSLRLKNAAEPVFLGMALNQVGPFFAIQLRAVLLGGTLLVALTLWKGLPDSRLCAYGLQLCWVSLTISASLLALLYFMNTPENLLRHISVSIVFPFAEALLLAIVYREMLNHRNNTQFPDSR